LRLTRAIPLGLAPLAVVLISAIVKLKVLSSV
jgi:hypothetical protein